MKQNLEPTAGTQGLYDFVVEELENVLVTYEESHIDHDDVYCYVDELYYRLTHYTEGDAGVEIEISCIFDELLRMDLGIFSKCLHQAAIVYSVFLADVSNTDQPQLRFSWYASEDEDNE